MSAAGRVRVCWSVYQPARCEKESITPNTTPDSPLINPALAGLLGEATFSEQIHQGEKGVLYIESVGSLAMLVLIFDTSVPIGRVKVYVKKTSAGLLAVLEKSVAPASPTFGPTFSDKAEALLGELLG